ncbi:MAG: Cys-tRNA(Pro) deacylase [Bacteroidetes bacterium]|nr:MAG: Cys-tRNA(Pro) deacylase [Bacteroidota bacterium]
MSYPITTAIRFLREKNISFEPMLYAYEEHGGTKRSSEELNVPEKQIIKTIVMKTDEGEPFIILMHGDREVSMKQLARTMGVKQITMCSEAEVTKFTGYVVGGTSPFGTKRRLDVYVESSIFALPYICINGGKRGFLVKMHPMDLKRAFEVVEVEVGID